MDDFSTYLDLPVSEMQLKVVGPTADDAELQYFSVPNDQVGMGEPMSNTPPGFEHLVGPNNLSDANIPSGGTIGSTPVWTPNQQGQGDVNMLNGGKASLAVKRKAEIGPLSYNSFSQPSLFHAKRPAHNRADGNSFVPLQPLGKEKKSAPVQSVLRSPGLQSHTPPNKKMVRNDSLPANSGLQRGQSAKKQTARMGSGSGSKARPESSEAIRSKMRESLAAALDIPSEKPENVSSIVNGQTEETSADHVCVDSQASESNATNGHLFPSQESRVDDKITASQVLSAELPPNGESGKIFQEFQYSPFLPDDDVSFSDNFLVKDDLLQGNGLSWAFELDAQVKDENHAQDAEIPPPIMPEVHKQKNVPEKAKLKSIDLALIIEGELFKLFGGVNKKYKEKGRSLLFNLKDRSNPELRERVMSGEISPERLCAMSAEELASKELSEWRMAKAEEFAQMVVLPDTEVDMRRLVKKTHKGEYQVVEIDRDEGIVTEVSGGTTMMTQRPLKKKTGTLSPSKTSTEDKENFQGPEKQESQDSLIIPTDGTDVMQGIMVDELKDQEVLPAIVSLDEFMESLNAEPPFDNLSKDAAIKSPASRDGSSKTMSNSQPSDIDSGSPGDSGSRKFGIKKFEVDVPVKVLPSTSVKVDYIWQGKLQLTLASSVMVGSVFQSGEKTSTKEWTTLLEIKGKVRIDAFEKFLQELPMSRTRAVMIIQFVLKDKSSEEESSYLSEAVESYITEERLGYAEPAAGVELYLYPPIPRLSEMLNKHMPKEKFDNSNEKGLVGIVVWRRAHISNATSSSSHHKQNSKRQHQQQSYASTPKRVHQDSFSNVSRTRVFNNNNNAKAVSVEEDDDIPPGFGPAARKDDDDLPEFNFSNSLPHKNVKPLDKVRELIQKYGKSNSVESPPSTRGNLNVQPWNNDDDDDIPEWKPNLPHQHLVVTQPQVQLPPGGRWPGQTQMWRHHQ